MGCVGVDRREKAAGSIDRGCKEDGVEGFGGEVLPCSDLDVPWAGVGLRVLLDSCDRGVEAESLRRDRGDEAVDERAQAGSQSGEDGRFRLWRLGLKGWV